MEKTQRKSTIHAPNPVLYALARGLARCFLWIRGGLRVSGDPIPTEGPLLVVASHQGMLDFLILGLALPRRRVQFVATDRFFRGWLARWFFGQMGVIPKTQFHADPRCIAAMLRTLKRDGTVGLFPAGQTSMCGVPAAVPPAVARLVKKAGAPVAAVRIDGSFFAKSRFAKGVNRCPIQVETRLLFTPEQLKTREEPEIYRDILQAIDYNEFEWQQRTGVTVGSTDRASGYPDILYLCPKCGSRYTMTERRHTLLCSACGNRGVVEPDMHIRPCSDTDVMPATMLDWYRMQQDQLRAEIARPDFTLQEPVTAIIFPGDQPHEAGLGRLILDTEGIRYAGRIDGESVLLSLRHGGLPGLAAKPGAYIELYHEQVGLVQYVPDHPACVTRWKIAQELLYEMVKK